MRGGISPRVLASVLLLLLVGACGGGQHVSRTAAQARASSTSAPAAQTSAPAAESSPPTGPAKAPAIPPVLAVRAGNGAVGAVAADGTWLWSFDPKSAGLADRQFVAAGPNLIAFEQGSAAQGVTGAITVVDRAGGVVYRGAYTAAVLNGGMFTGIWPDPSGTRWAWSTLDSAPQTPASTSQPWVSSVWVGGVGLQPRKLKSWSEPNGTEVDVRMWSDDGIVLLTIAATCGWDPKSSSLLDPSSGGEQPLFGPSVVPLDVHAGVQVGMDTSSNSVVLAGAARGAVKYDLPIHRAGVNPGGTRIEVSTLGMSGCGGVFTAATAVIDVGSGSQATIPNFFADAWLDDDHLLGRTALPAPVQSALWSSHIQVADLAGHVTDVVQGNLIGVLRG